MEYREIGTTGLRVSPLCLGTMTFGSPVGERDAIDIVRRALDHGINFIDTANMYEGYARTIGSPGGVAEQILGKALAGRRDQAVLATKVGMKIGPEDDDEGLSPAHIRRECDRSLARLATDRIDLYYMHKPDDRTPIGDSIEAFSDLIQEGKARHWGVSNFDADQVRQVMASCLEGGWPRPAVHQPPYSLINRGIEQDLLPLCREEGIAVVPYQVLQGGLLTGKYTDNSALPEGTRAAEKPDWIPMLKDDEALAEVERLRAQAEAEGISLYD
ncbi:MAG: aldo/keto reductase, partial [Candidatus Latescibacteria bacterium]|nr:aldo/keto reductase [Candidatus Latescibacterota bacterium]